MAEIKKETREDLRDLFKTGNIPTEDDFASIFESSLNQADDGIRKEASGPLDVQAAPENGTPGELELIRFYQDFVDENGTALDPKWRMKLVGDALKIAPEGVGDGLVMDGSGNMGIGTNPAHKLEVDGDVKVTGTFSNEAGGEFVVQGAQDGGAGRGIYMWDHGDPNMAIYMAGSAQGKTIQGDVAPVAGAGGITSHALRFRVLKAGTGGVVFENSNNDLLASIRATDGLTYIKGNLGLGIEPDGFKLNVNGKARVSGNMGIGVTPDNIHKLKVLGRTWFDGNMGIGTSPHSTHKLNVGGDAKISGNLGIGSTPSGSEKLKVEGKARFNGNMGIGTTPHNSHRLNVSGDSKFNGNVGIGIGPSGSYKLKVQGDVNVDGFFSNEGGGAFVVQQGQDGGAGRGIYMWRSWR